MWLSPISIWETLILAEKGKLRLEPNPLVWVREALKRWPVKEAAINNNISIKSREIDLPHQDPADRFISATALIYDIPVMTLDERLLSAPWLSTIEPAKLTHHPPSLLPSLTPAGKVTRIIRFLKQ